MTELLKMTPNKDTPNPWTEVTEDSDAKLDKKSERELKKYQQMELAVSIAKNDEPRKRREDESLEDYEDYIVLYFQGEVIIDRAREKGESREECANRLLQEYRRKTENLGNPKFEAPKSA